jgi:DNA-binding Xre family transcriptional regulator
MVPGGCATFHVPCEFCAIRDHNYKRAVLVKSMLSRKVCKPEKKSARSGITQNCMHKLIDPKKVHVLRGLRKCYSEGKAGNIVEFKLNFHVESLSREI